MRQQIGCLARTHSSQMTVSLCPHKPKGTNRLSPAFYPVHEDARFMTDHFLKALHPTSIRLKVKFQHMMWVGTKVLTFQLQQSVAWNLLETHIDPPPRLEITRDNLALLSSVYQWVSNSKFNFTILSLHKLNSMYFSDSFNVTLDSSILVQKVNFFLT